MMSSSTVTVLVVVVVWMITVPSMGVNGQGVQLMFLGVSYPNNTVLPINDIGEFSTGSTSAVLCTTNRSPCCQSPPNRFGEWYYPDGSVVPNDASGEDFYRSRTDLQTISLSRRNNAQSPTGSFCCELPDSSSVTHRLCVKLVTVAASITPSVASPIVGSQYTLTCGVTVTGADGLDSITYEWLKETATIPDETQSTLSFSSLSLADAGQYRCEATVSSTSLNRVITAMSNTQNVTLQIPPPTSVTVTPSNTDTIVPGSSLILTCTIQLSSTVNTAITVNTVWSGPAGTQFTTITSVATMMTATTYTSTATINSVATSNAGVYTCSTTISSTSQYLTTSDPRSGMYSLTVGQGTVSASITPSVGNPDVGSQYTLTCGVNGADGLNPTIAYQWFKDNTVVSDETQSTLSFSSVSLSDAGQYRCRVTVSSTLLSQPITAMSNTQDLTLQIPPPTSVTVTPSNTGTIFVGSSLTLTCTIRLSSTGNTAVTVNEMWSGPTGAQFTSTSATMITATTYTSTATFNSVATSDAGDYTCSATISSTSQYLTTSDQRSGIYSVTVEPVTVSASITLPVGSPAVGSQYTLTCGVTVTGADEFDPIITYQWFKDNTVVSDETQSTLSFSSLSLSDAGQYRCRVTVSSTLLSQSITVISNTQDLTLQIPPPTSVTVTSSNTGTIFVGSSLTLTCTIRLSSTVNTAVTVNEMWTGPTRAQFTTTSATMMTATTYTSTATFNSVATSDAGVYTCSATISSTSQYLTTSDPRSGMYSLTVFPRPSSPTIDSTDIQSTSITITWSQPAGNVVQRYEIAYFYHGPCTGVTPVTGSFTVNGNTRQYTVTNLQEFSEYTISLTAVNDAGRELTSMRLTTSPSAPSGPPQSLMVTSTTPFSITIQWSEVECLQQNSVITGYSVRYGRMTASVTGASNGMFTATDLNPSTSYTIEVAAVSSSGTGPFAMVTTQTRTPLTVSLLLNNVPVSNNSIVTLDEIGEDSAALHCLTNNTDCCRSSDTPQDVGAIGRWVFPGGSSVDNDMSGDAIYQGRGPSFVRLQHRNNAQTTGVFRCEVPDASGTNQQLYVGVYPVTSGSPSITDLSYDRPSGTLTCTSTGGPATTVTWTHNNTQIIMDETNIQEQRIANAALGEYQNILTINSNTLDAYVGNFACVVSNSRGMSDSSIVIQGTQITGHEQPFILGETAAIECSSDLEVERIEWLNSDNDVVASNFREQELTLNFETVNHSVNNTDYTCRITTSRPSGITAQSVTLTVGIRNEPFPPQDIVSSKTTAESVKISWSVPILASTQEIYVVLYGVNSINENTSMAQQSQPGVQDYDVTLCNLQPSTRYMYSVRATNEHSSTSSGVKLFFTIETSRSSETSNNLTGPIAGMAAVIVILVLLLFISGSINVVLFLRQKKSVQWHPHKNIRQQQSVSEAVTWSNTEGVDIDTTTCGAYEVMKHKDQRGNRSEGGTQETAAVYEEVGGGSQNRGRVYVSGPTGRNTAASSAAVTQEYDEVGPTHHGQGGMAVSTEHAQNTGGAHGLQQEATYEVTQ